jgi:hypothetical protein
MPPAAELTAGSVLQRMKLLERAQQQKLWRLRVVRLAGAA